MELFNENRKCKRIWSIWGVCSLPPHPPPGLLAYIRVLQLTSHVCQANDSAYLTPGKIRESGGNWFSDELLTFLILTSKRQDLVWKNYNLAIRLSLSQLKVSSCFFVVLTPNKIVPLTFDTGNFGEKKYIFRHAMTTHKLQIKRKISRITL